jgi:hypothetical protein
VRDRQKPVKTGVASESASQGVKALVGSQSDPSNRYALVAPALHAARVEFRRRHGRTCESVGERVGLSAE